MKNKTQLTIALLIFILVAGIIISVILITSNDENPDKKGNGNPPDQNAEPFRLSLSVDLTQQDIETLKQHKNIFLTIEEEGIDISLLSQLDSLEILSISQSEDIPGNPPLFFISDFSFLRNIISLRALNLDCGGFEFNSDNIANLSNLEKLTINNAIISSDEEIKGFPNIKELKIYGSQINSIDPFCGLNLYSFTLYGCEFEDRNLDSINEISSLKELIIDFCNDIEFTAFNGLNNLKTLTIKGNDIALNFESLLKLTQLEELSVRYEQFTHEQRVAFVETNPNCILFVGDGQTQEQWIQAQG